MKENYLTAENYYETYSGWDLRLMYERIKKMQIPDNNREQLSTKEKANILILGSATPDNLSRIAQIDSYLRPGKVEQDVAIIIDQNMHPLAKHKEDILCLEGKDGWSNTPKSTPEFPLPKFELSQADIRELPFKNNEVDIIISDYTLNYLETIEDINRTFEEISRVLSTNGLVFISLRGNEKYPYQKENPIKLQNDVQQKNQGGVMVNYFPLHTYFEIAKNHNLNIVNTDNAGTDICALIVKKQESPN
ncbi:MAG: class I SAM-dependent methyltransferase [Candidatus Moraniibacteriota bacterium]